MFKRLLVNIICKTFININQKFNRQGQLLKPVSLYDKIIKTYINFSFAGGIVHVTVAPSFYFWYVNAETINFGGTPEIRLKNIIPYPGVISLDYNSGVLFVVENPVEPTTEAFLLCVLSLSLDFPSPFIVFCWTPTISS